MQNHCYSVKQGFIGAASTEGHCCLLALGVTSARYLNNLMLLDIPRSHCCSLSQKVTRARKDIKSLLLASPMSYFFSLAQGVTTVRYRGELPLPASRVSSQLATPKRHIAARWHR